LDFLFIPGEKYSYSGEGFEYLKKALEHKFNKSLEELSDSILFTTLGMKSTKYYWGEEIDESRYAYKHDSEGKVYEEGIQKYANAAYGLLTTVEDYSKFGIDVINQAGLSNNLFNEMVSTQTNIKENIDQGLGWQIIRNLPDGEYGLLHEGGSNGVSTLVVLLPVSKRGIVIFTNGDKGDKVYLKVLETFIDVGQTINRDMLQMSYDPDAIKTVEISNDILTTYAGSYFVPSFQMTVKILYEDNLLKLESPYAKMILYAESETNFFLKDDDLRIEFIKDEPKKITGFMMTFQGAEPEFSKKME
jgi:CubicO group peptidase (beta-lactamase class C family)